MTEVKQVYDAINPTISIYTGSWKVLICSLRWATPQSLFRTFMLCDFRATGLMKGRWTSPDVLCSAWTFYRLRVEVVLQNREPESDCYGPGPVFLLLPFVFQVAGGWHADLAVLLLFCDWLSLSAILGSSTLIGLLTFLNPASPLL